MYFLMRGFAQDRGFLWGELCATRPLLFLGRVNFFSDVPKVKNVIRLSSFDPFIRMTKILKHHLDFLHITKKVDTPYTILNMHCLGATPKSTAGWPLESHQSGHWLRPWFSPLGFHSWMLSGTRSDRAISRIWHSWAHALFFSGSTSFFDNRKILPMCVRIAAVGPLKTNAFCKYVK